jgi:hypothetical protein
MENIQLTFAHILRGFVGDRKRSQTPQIEPNPTEAFDCFTIITSLFTFILAGLPMDDFFDGSRTDGQVSDQPAVAFDGIALILLDRGAIAAGFASESKRSVHLRRVIVQMGALRFVRTIRSKAFDNSSLPSIVIPRTVEIIGSSCFRDCKSLSLVFIESDSLLRRIESGAFSSKKLRSVCLPGDVQSIAANAFPLFCKVSRG